MLNTKVKQLADDYLRMQEKYGDSHAITVVAKHAFDIVQDALTDCVADAATFFCSDCKKRKNCVERQCTRKQNFVENLINDNLYEL